jgi:hypothetical protein
LLNRVELLEQIRKIGDYFRHLCVGVKNRDTQIQLVFSQACFDIEQIIFVSPKVEMKLFLLKSKQLGQLFLGDLQLGFDLIPLLSKYFLPIIHVLHQNILRLSHAHFDNFQDVVVVLGELLRLEG